MKTLKKKIAFVGAFKPAGVDGTVGGITFACRTLMESEQSSRFHWLLIDSTATTNKQRSMLARSFPALSRVIQLLWYLLTNRCYKLVVFAAHGLSFYEKGLMTLVAGVFKVPVIFAPRSGFLVHELANSSAKAKFAKKVFSNCESIICQSEYWKGIYSHYCTDETKLKVIRNWIDTDRCPQGEANDKFPQTTVLFLSWVVKEKGIFDFLQAVNHLQEQGVSEFNTIICGDGDDFSAAVQYAQSNELRNVSFDGWTVGSDKAELLRAAHIYVLPSHAEGFSNSLLEAMASGLAVVSTEVGAASDVIQDGTNGFLVAPESVDELSIKLRKLIESKSLRQELGDAARQSILENNSIGVGVSRFMALLE